MSTVTAAELTPSGRGVLQRMPGGRVSPQGWRLLSRRKHMFVLGRTDGETA